MRSFLRCHKTTSVCMINGELGLKEVTEYIENRMLNFWCDIATGDSSKMSTILYNWTKSLYDQNIYKSVWLSKIKNILDNMGMTHLFNDITNINRNHFKNSVKLRLNDIHNQNWSSQVFNNSTCLNYRSMTTHKQLQNYFNKLPSQYRYALCKFKCANHKLPIVTGRYAGIVIDDRKCTLCSQNEIGDEFHYLFKCTFFNEDRNKYMKRYYYVQPNMDKMTKLFNTTNNKDTLNLGKFTYNIIQQFKSRN